MQNKWTFLRCQSFHINILYLIIKTRNRNEGGRWRRFFYVIISNQEKCKTSKVVLCMGGWIKCISRKENDDVAYGDL